MHLWRVGQTRAEPCSRRPHELLNETWRGLTVFQSSGVASLAQNCPIRNERRNLTGLHGAGKQESLHMIATSATHHFEGFLVFNTLSNSLESEVPGQLHDRFDDGHVTSVGGDVAYEGLIDFEPIQVEVLEISQVRIPGTKVIERNADAETS